MTRRYFKESESTIEVCPWGYFRCIMPAGERCIASDRINGKRELHEWLRETRRAQECQWRGEDLTEGQWQHKRIGELA